MTILSSLQNHKKLILFGLCSYVLFIYQLVDVISRSNNSLQVLVYLFSSSQSNDSSGKNMKASTEFAYGNSKCFFITITFVLFNLFILINNFLIKFLLFGELRLVEIENLNNRFIRNIINEIISITVMINREYAKSKSNNQTDINFFIRNSKRNYGLSILIYLVVSISLKVIFWINVDRLEMIYNRHSNEYLASSDEDVFFTGNTLKEDKNQLLRSNITFILKFYYSKYFLILFCLNWISIKMAFSYIYNETDTSSLTRISFKLFFSLFSIQLFTAWAHSIVQLIDAYKSKSQKDEITIKLRESMRAINKTTLESDSDAEIEEITDEESEDLDSDDEGIFSATETFEKKYRIELFIDVVSNILHVICRFAIGFTQNDFSGLASFFSNELLMRIHMIFTDSRKLLNIYNKYEQLQELPSPTEKECKNQDSCIICMDSLYPTKRQMALVFKGNQFRERSFIDATLNKFKPKILPCGHFLHLYCLKNWFERSRNCPICRMDIFESSTGKLKKQQVFRNRSHSYNTTPPPPSTTTTNEDFNYLNENDQNGVPLEAEVYEEDNKESFHHELNIAKKTSIDKMESVSTASVHYDYKDVSNHGNSSNSIAFKTYKHKEPVYYLETDNLILCSYDFYVNDSKFKLEHQIKLESHEEAGSTHVDNKNLIKVKLDTSGFIPV